MNTVKSNISEEQIVSLGYIRKPDGSFSHEKNQFVNIKANQSGNYSIFIIGTEMVNECFSLEFLEERTEYFRREYMHLVATN
jgi:hypothetical protein